jgi:hypothetical protein
VPLRKNSCIFGGFSKKLGSGLAKLLCFLPLRAQIPHLQRMSKDSLLKFRTKKRYSVGFLRKILLPNPWSSGILKPETSLPDKGLIS